MGSIYWKRIEPFLSDWVKWSDIIRESGEQHLVISVALRWAMENKKVVCKAKFGSKNYNPDTLYKKTETLDQIEKETDGSIESRADTSSNQ